MMNIKRFVSVLVVSAVTVLTVSAQTGNSEHPFLKFSNELNLQTVYSVDMNINMMGISVASKTYQDGEKSRYESVIPILNIKTTTIQTMKDGELIAYILFPASRKYLIQTSDEASESAEAPEYTVTDLGTEVFNDERCNKKRIVIKGDESSTIDILFSPKQRNMPVKMTTGLNGDAKSDEESVVAVMAFTDYVFEKPDASLFTIPKDYTEAVTMEEAMGGIGGLFGILGAMAAAGNANEEDPDDVKAQEEALEEIAKALEEATRSAKEAAVKDAKDSSIEKGAKTVIRGLLGR